MHGCWSQVNCILLALSADGIDKVGLRLPTTYPLKRTERKGANLTAPQRAAPTEEPLAAWRRARITKEREPSRL
jgi:hypothetical protein